MPPMGLIRGVARTAAIAGTATAVSNRVSRRQAGRWAAQDQAAQAPPEPAYAEPAPPPPAPVYYQAPPPPPAPPAVDMDTKLEQLKELGQLRDQGVLSEAEFEVQKSRILTG
jgi:Short C-terminal domain